MESSRDNLLLEKFTELCQAQFDEKTQTPEATAVWMLTNTVHSDELSITEAQTSMPGQDVGKNTLYRFVFSFESDPIRCLGVFSQKPNDGGAESKWEVKKKSEELDEDVLERCLSDDLLGETESVDLGALMGSLSRDQLEMMVVKLCAHYPKAADILQQEADKKIDPAQIDNLCDAMFGKDNFTNEGSFPKLLELLKRGTAQAKSNNIENALTVLNVLSSKAVEFFAREECELQTDPRSEHFFSYLEESWQKCLDVIQDEGKLANCNANFLSWRDVLGGTEIGPIFSDNIRGLKKRKKVVNSQSRAQGSKRIKLGD